MAGTTSGTPVLVFPHYHESCKAARKTPGKLKVIAEWNKRLSNQNGNCSHDCTRSHQPQRKFCYTKSLSPSAG